MNTLIISDISVQQDAQGRYSINDLHRAAQASGITKDIRPNEWLSLQTTQDLAEILITENPSSKPIHASAGRYGGTHVCKELVYAYAMWVSAAFHLKVIRTFDALMTAKVHGGPVKATLKAAKLFPPLFQTARLIGCDQNAAALSANQAVRKLTNIDLLSELGHTHLIA